MKDVVPLQRKSKTKVRQWHTNIIIITTRIVAHTNIMSITMRITMSITMRIITSTTTSTTIMSTAV